MSNWCCSSEKSILLTTHGSASPNAARNNCCICDCIGLHLTRRTTYHPKLLSGGQGSAGTQPERRLRACTAGEPARPNRAGRLILHPCRQAPKRKIPGGRGTGPPVPPTQNGGEPTQLARETARSLSTFWWLCRSGETAMLITSRGGSSRIALSSTRWRTTIMANEPGFNAAMMNIYRRALNEAKYSATRFLQMLHDHGGLETAQILIHGDGLPADLGLAGIVVEPRELVRIVIRRPTVVVGESHMGNVGRHALLLNTAARGGPHGEVQHL